MEAVLGLLLPLTAAVDDVGTVVPHSIRGGGVHRNTDTFRHFLKQLFEVFKVHGVSVHVLSTF